MNLKQVIDTLNNIAISQPEINQVIESGNIYDLNSERNAKFGVFCATQRTHSYDLEAGQNTFNFFLYYVDRQQSDNDNKIEVQSTAIEVLKNIIRTFAYEYDIEVLTVDFDVFEESFAQLCAGAYATVSIVADDENNCLDIF